EGRALATAEQEIARQRQIDVTSRRRVDQHVLELPSQAVGGVLRCHRLDRLADGRVAEALLRTRRGGADDRHGGQGRRICVDQGRAPLPRLPVQEDTGGNV